MPSRAVSVCWPLVRIAFPRRRHELARDRRLRDSVAVFRLDIGAWKPDRTREFPSRDVDQCTKSRITSLGWLSLATGLVTAFRGWIRLVYRSGHYVAWMRHFVACRFLAWLFTQKRITEINRVVKSIQSG